MVLLGNVALFCRQSIEYDRKNMKIVNDSDANRYLRREYRQGWAL
jgi:hypothetical protein